MYTKRIFSKEVAFELLKRGHDIVRTEPNHKYKFYKVFIFEKTDKLLEDITIINDKKKTPSKPL